MGQNKKWQTHILLGIVFFVTSCGSGEVESPITNPNAPTPTTHPIFGEQEGDSSITEDMSDVINPDTSSPTNDDLPTRRPTNIASFSIYNDSLSPSWELANSQSMTYELQNDTYAYSGDNSIVAAPTDAFGELYFTVSGESMRQFPRDEVLGVSFWIYGGEEYIGTSDLAVSVVGSNEHSFWALDDNSVENPGDGQPTFPETRFYYLGLNRDIPPETWVNVEVWMDNLQFDPVYEYVTGFYIKNDEVFGQTFYVDDVRIMLLGEDE